MKKRILAVLLPALLVANLGSCKSDPPIKIRVPLGNTDTAESPGKSDTDTIGGEYDSATKMCYYLNGDGKSYSVCPQGLPDVVKELVFPAAYKGLPVTEISAYISEISIETIIIPEGIKVIKGSFDCCFNIKNIYIPASAIYIGESTFNSHPTMGYPSFIKSNVIEKIVVAEGNPYYHVKGNCLIERRSKKIILGCNSSVIPDDRSVKIIGKNAFANCKSIETIILPESIIELEYGAFNNCEKLKQVYITSSATKDKKVINFDTETVFGYDPNRKFYVPDAESLEIYSKLYGPYTSFEIGNP